MLNYCREKFLKTKKTWHQNLFEIIVSLSGNFKGRKEIKTVFEFRYLTLQQGRYFGILGECVIAASVAQKLDLKVGNIIISAPENLFDLGGVYPLKMKIVGILNHNQTADDLAIFVDLKTAWIIEGLGHGHLDLANTKFKKDRYSLGTPNSRQEKLLLLQ